MLTLKDWFEIVDYRISEGSDYGWNCYGTHSYQLDSWKEISVNGFSIIFDTKTQEVYEVQVHDYKNNRAYRLINPLFYTQYMNEADNRGVSCNNAWDDVSYIDLESVDDWVEKANAIIAGADYDTRVSIPVNFTDAELLSYMKIAHERDITFNELIELSLRAALDEYNADPIAAAERAIIWKNTHDNAR